MWRPNPLLKYFPLKHDAKLETIFRVLLHIIAQLAADAECRKIIPPELPHVSIHVG